jgi:aspartate carbamoyltransferase catalytic subunit
MVDLKGKDILRADQFTRDEVELIIKTAQKFEDSLNKGRMLDNCRGLILATLFFEPSTRTRLSFETAMLRLGGQVITVADPQSSSVSKGESLHDTIKTVENYADVIVLRHPKIGAAAEAAAATERPVINAGDGAGQHPTQSLLDVYTILKEKGTIDGLTIACVGDLKYGRTVHSLAELLSLYKVRLIFVSPISLRMPAELINKLKEKGVPTEETEDLKEALKKSDVLYMTRIQKERFEDQTEYERLKGVYILTRSVLKDAKKEIIIMHPLPRVNEIATDVDSYEGAAYFRQVANGVPVRMALLALVTGRI